MNESRRNLIILGVAILAIAGFWYVLWTRTAPPPLPTLAPDQTIKTPLGSGRRASPGGAPAAHH